MKKTKKTTEESAMDITWTFIFNFYVIFLFVFLVMVGVNAVLKEQTKKGDPVTAEAKTLDIKPPSAVTDNTIFELNLTFSLQNPEPVAVFWYVQSTVFNLTSEEIQDQLETAKVSGLKRRVRRFACWHSCFGKFTKKVIRKPYTAQRKTPPTLAPDSSDENAVETTSSVMKASAESDDETTPVSDVDNELDENTGVRKKKESNPEEFFKEGDNSEGENKQTFDATQEIPPLKESVQVEGTKDEVSVTSEIPSETEAQASEEEGSEEDNESGESESGENGDDTSGSEEEDDDAGKDKPEAEDDEHEDR